MPKLNRKEIQDAARSVLERETGGIRWVRLLNAVESNAPETPHNSIHGAIHALLTSSEDIVKVARGTYQLAKYQDQTAPGLAAGNLEPQMPAIQVESAGHVKVSLQESDFYETFAHWLEETAEEVTVAAAVGGNMLKQKWGTPDVIGVLRPQAQDIVKFESQIVSAEIKIDPAQPVVAFGQAVAYRLFSHKSFIAVPKTTGEDDLARLKALCSIHGVGLVTFTLDKDAPDYTTLVPAQQASPDMFYANQMARRLLDVSKPLFKKLFP
jgi:hypothetical protein